LSGAVFLYPDSEGPIPSSGADEARADVDTVKILLTPSQDAAIQVNELSQVYINPGAVTDYKFGNWNGDRKRDVTFVDDATSPTLKGGLKDVTFDHITKVLAIHFSESVNASEGERNNIRTSLTIKSNISSSTLVGAAVTTGYDLTLTITLTDAQRDIFKGENPSLDIAAGAIKDISGNGIDAVMDIPVWVTPPLLNSVNSRYYTEKSADTELGYLELEFTEELRRESTDATNISLGTTDGESNFITSFVLMQGELLSSQLQPLNKKIIKFGLIESHKNALAKMNSIYVKVHPAAVRDVYDRPNEEITHKQIREYDEPPRLLLATYNHYTKQLDMRLDEKVKVIYDLDPTVDDDIDQPRSELVQVTNGVNSVTLSREERMDGQQSEAIRFIFILADAHRDTIASWQTPNLSVVLQSGAFRDLADNPIARATMALSDVVLDTTPPSVVAASYFPASRRLIIKVDEVAGAIDSSRMFVLKNPGASQKVLTGDAPDSDGKNVVINNVMDVSGTQDDPHDILRTGSDPRLDLAEGAIRDLAGNPMPATYGIDVHVDMSPPGLESASYTHISLEGDPAVIVQDGMLKLTFDESIDVATVNLEKIALGTSYDFSLKFSLKDADGTYAIVEGTENGGRILNIRLGTDEKVNIVSGWGRDGGDLTVTLSAGAIEDMAGLGNQAVMQVIAPWMKDTRRPVFKADLSAYYHDKAEEEPVAHYARLSLVFDEEMDTRAIYINAANILLSRDLFGGPTIQLTDSEIKSKEYSNVIDFNLTAEHQEMITRWGAPHEGYGESYGDDKDTLYVQLLGDAVMDRGGNLIAEMPLRVALGTWRKDTDAGDTDAPAGYVSSAYNANTKVLTITFDEWMDTKPNKNVHLANLVIQDKDNAAVTNLDGASVVENDRTKTVTITLTKAQHNAINDVPDNKLPLKIHTGGTIRDISGEGCEATVNGRAINFTADVTGPAFEAVAYRTDGIGILTITFNEYLYKPSTLNVSQADSLASHITLSNSLSDGQSFHLTGNEIQIFNPGAVVGDTGGPDTFKFVLTDAHQAKILTWYVLYLEIADGFVSDRVGNSSPSVPRTKIIEIANAPPIIELEPLITDAKAGEPITIEAKVSDDKLALQSVKLHYQVGEYTAFTLMEGPVEGGVYSAIIPAEYVDKGLKYYIEASDDRGTSTTVMFTKDKNGNWKVTNSEFNPINVEISSTLEIEIVSGNNQSGNINIQLPNPLVVLVKDPNGQPTSGVTVTFVVTAGNGSVQPDTSTTDVQGQASTNWTLGPNEGANNVTASVTKVTHTTFTATGIIPVGSVSLDPTTGPVGTLVKVTGEEFEPNAEAGKLTINGEETPIFKVGGTIVKNDGSIRTNEDGVFIVKFLVPKQPGGGAIVAVGEMETPFVITAQISVTPESGPIGTTIKVVGDGFEREEPVSVDFGSAKEVATGKTTSDGSFEVTFKVDTPKVGTKEIVATGLLSERTANANFELISSLPATISIEANPTEIVADGVSTSVFTVTVKDANGYGVGGQNITVTPGKGKVSSAEYQGGGVYLVTYMSDTKAGMITLFASTENNITDQTEITLTAGPPDTVTVESNPDILSAAGSAPSIITATISDANGNLCMDAIVTMELSGVGGTLSNASGEAGEKVTAENKGDGTYTATYTAANQKGTVFIKAITQNGKEAQTEISLSKEANFVFSCEEPPNFCEFGYAQPGKPLVYFIDGIGQNGFELPMELLAKDLPKGVEWEFNPAVASPTVASPKVKIQLTLRIPDTLEQGEYNFTAFGMNLEKGITRSLVLSFTVQKVESDIFVIVTPKEVPLGGVIRVSGQVSLQEDDERTDLEIQLAYQFDDEMPIERTAIAKGTQREYADELAITDDIALGKLGEWKVKVCWNGDSKYQAVCREALFTVHKGKGFLRLKPSVEMPNLGEKVTITVKLLPELREQLLYLEIIPPDGNIDSKENTTGELGIFQYEFTPTQRGDYTFEATWEGNDSYEPVSEKITITAVKEPARAIIVLGGGDETTNPHWLTFNRIAQHVYKTFRRCNKENLDIADDEYIFFLSPSKQASDIIDKPTSVEWLKYAVTEWAKERVNKYVPLVIYLISHNRGDKFLLAKGNQDVYLTPEMLNEWLSVLSEGMPVIIVIEACYSGRFITKTLNGKTVLSKFGRTIITSASEEERAELLRNKSSFSKYFFDAVEKNQDILTAFFEASETISHIPQHSHQKPQLDANGNGIPNEEIDYTLLGQTDANKKIYIPDEGICAGEPPEIEWVVCEPAALRAGENKTTIRAKISGLDISDVIASITPPIYDESELETSFDEIELLDKGGSLYEAEYDKFILSGTYTVVVNATNPEGDAIPEIAILTVEGEKTCPWDVNGDGEVDISDLVLVGINFGKSGANIKEDVDGDGRVDIKDLILVGKHFGFSATSCRVQK